MQSKINISILLVIIITAFILMNSTQTAPASQVTIQQLMDESIEKKMQQFINTRNNKCLKDIMKEANQRADSIVMSMAKSMIAIQDSITRPLAPDRPDRPALLTPIDSSFPAPLLDTDSLIFQDK